MNLSLELVMSVVGALAGVVAVLSYWDTKRRLEEERPNLITAAADKVVAMMRAQMDEMTEEMGRCKTELRDLHIQVEMLEQELNALRKTLCEYQNGTSLLIHQVKANGMQPVWVPKDLIG